MNLRAHSKWLLVALLAAVAVLGGCAPGSADMGALEGTWVVDSFGGPTELVPADPNVTSDLTLKAGTATGTGGVNTFSGTYDAPGDGKISFGPLAATAMAGPPAAMEQETRFFSALEEVKRYELSAGKLVLGDKGNNTLVVLVPK